jgi:hypothetical protein
MNRKRLGTESAGVREGRIKLRKAALPLALVGIVGTPKHTDIPVAKLGELGIDERYQRREIRGEVNAIIHAMVAGGIVPDPVKVARRADGSLWIVDGQQRYWAHVRMKRPLAVMIYEVDGIETERGLFTIFNTRRAVNANHRVNAWNGESAEMIRRLNAKPDSAFFEQIDLGSNRGRPFSAAVLIKAVASVLCSSHTAAGSIDGVLLAVDGALRLDPAKAMERATAVLHTLARIFNPKKQNQMRFLPAIAIAQVCKKKWDAAGRVISPTPRQFVSLGSYDWERGVEGFALKYLPTLMAQVEKRWK